MVESVPSSIGLSPVQREILKLIIQHQASVQGSAEPERVILLWSEGVSSRQPRRNLALPRRKSKPCVIAGGHRRCALQPQNGSGTRHLAISCLLFSEVPNEKTSSETALYSSEGSAQTSSQSRNTSRTQRLKTRGKSAHRNPSPQTKRVRDQQEQLDPRKPRCCV